MNKTSTVDKSQTLSARKSLRSIKDIIDDLSKPVHPQRLKTRMQGDTELTYIPWYQAVRYLDHYAPGWRYEIRSIDQIGDRCVVTVRITIPSLEGEVWREATGQEELNCTSYGDSSSNAESMALRRAAAKFGLCLYLYDK